MGFAAGFNAGANAVRMGQDATRQKTLDARADKEYADQDTFRQKIAEENRAYHEGVGAYAEPGTGVDNSSDRVEAQRLGVQVPTQAAVPAVPVHRQDRDRIYNERLGALADTMMPPERAAQYKQNLSTLTQANWDKEMQGAFRGVMAGNAESLQKMSEMYKMIPDGAKIETSQAFWDPQKNSWENVRYVRKDGTADYFPLDEKALRRLSVFADRGQTAAMLGDFKKEGLAEAAGARDDKRLGLATEAQASNERFRGEELGLRREELKATREDRKAQRAVSWASLDLSKQKLDFEKLKETDAEKARDLMTRQGIFAKQFDPGIKLTELSSDDDKQSVAQARTLAALATNLYAGSTEGVEPKTRNAVQAEAVRCTNDYANAKLDPKKFQQQADGTYSYGRLMGIPEDIAGQVIRSGEKPAAKPGKEPAKKAEPQRMGVQVESQQGDQVLAGMERDKSAKVAKLDAEVKSARDAYAAVAKSGDQAAMAKYKTTLDAALSAREKLGN